MGGHSHKIAVGPPQTQEMSTQLLATSSNLPSGSVPVSLRWFLLKSQRYTYTASYG